MGLDCLTLTELASIEDDNTVIPELFTEFLTRLFDLTQYESQKNKYLALIATKKRKRGIYQHLEESYALMNFWRSMYLSVNAECERQPGSTGLPHAKGLQNFMRKYSTTPCEHVYLVYQLSMFETFDEKQQQVRA